jgi:hypothetical protein
MNFECELCSREFTTRQSMYYHRKNNVCQKSKHLICEFCGKEYSSAPSLSRHRSKSCKEKKKVMERDAIIEEINSKNNRKIENIYDMFVKMREENDQLKVKVTRLENDPQTVNNTNNYNNINVNNGTVNNIYLVGYGKEDMSKIDRDDLLKVFRTGFNSPLILTETMHFNPKYPEFHNVYIRSMKEKYAMLYDGNSWTMVMKDDLIDKMYDNKRDYIEENLEDFINSLTNSQRKALQRWMDVDDNFPYIKKVKDDIKLLMYNKREMALNNKNCSKKSNNYDTNTYVSYDDLDKITNSEIVMHNKNNKRNVVVSRKGTKRKKMRATANRRL